MIVDEFTRRILSRYCRTEAFKRPFCFTTRRFSVLFLPILDKLRENGLKSLLRLSDYPIKSSWKYLRVFTIVGLMLNAANFAKTSDLYGISIRNGFH